MALSVNKRSAMTLFSSSNDIYSHQVRIVLAEKGVSVEIEQVDQNNFPQDLIHLNPYCSLPILIDRNLTLYKSSIIMEYLDERFPHPPLMPVYPVSRSESRLMIHRIEKDWYSLMRSIKNNLEKKEAEIARKKLREELLAIELLFSRMPFFMSKEFSLVDCYLAPLLWRLPSLGIEITITQSKNLTCYMNRIFERNSFLASLTEVEREIHLKE